MCSIIGHNLAINVIIKMQARPPSISSTLFMAHRDSFILCFPLFYNSKWPFSSIFKEIDIFLGDSFFLESSKKMCFLMAIFCLLCFLC